MGVHHNIGYWRFPKQGMLLGEAVTVCFSYNTSRALNGIIVRDDVEDPWQTVIALEDGRYVLGTEVQFSGGSNVY